MKKNNHNPKFSVIIPTYNRANLLKQAVESVLKQTYDNFEVLVVDDYSVDKTPLVMRGIQKESNKKIEYVRLEENSGGPSKPINMGVKMADGKYVYILGDDDKLLPDALEKLSRGWERAQKREDKIGAVAGKRVDSKFGRENFQNNLIINYKDFIKGNMPSVGLKEAILKKAYAQRNPDVVGLETIYKKEG